MENRTRTGFIFDMDGVLVDNAHYHTKAWLLLLERLGITVDEQSFHLENAGQTNAAILRWKLGEDVPAETINDYAQEKEALYRQLYHPHLAPLPGLHAFLDRSLALGIPMALATSAEEQNIDLVLDGLDLRHFFSVIVGADDVRHSKPHPEIFLVAARRLGLSPQDCVVLEDSTAGLEAARRAGMRLVLIATSLKGGDPDNGSLPDLAVPDFVHLDPGQIIGYFPLLP